MTRSVNRVTLLGNLGKDAETKFTSGGVAKTTFSVATARRWKDGEEWKEQTTWHNVVLWRNDQLSNYLTKGKQIYIEGRLDNRSYEKDGEKRYITEVIADQVILLGGRDGEQPVSAPRSAQRQVPTAPKYGPDHGGIDDSDVPF